MKGAVHGTNGFSDCVVHSASGLARTVDPESHFQIDHLLTIRLAGLCQTHPFPVDDSLFGGRFALEAAEACAYADHCNHSLGKFDSRIQGNLTAAAVAYQSRTVDTEIVQNSDQVRASAEFDVVGRRSAERTEVVPHDSETRVHQPGNHRVPGLVVRDGSVKQHDRRPVTFADGKEPTARNRYESFHGQSIHWT